MIVVQRPTFRVAHAELVRLMRDAPAVRTERWQGKDVKDDPAATTYELRNVEVSVPLYGIEDLDHWRTDVEPNLPWADDHFAERVGGEPLNPGEEWKRWPWAESAARFRDRDELWNHSYPERLWPKYPRQTSGGRIAAVTNDPRRIGPRDPMRGISWEYGDLQDLVELLAVEPHTRQAWIPLFFPEDTGVGDGGRKPCSLGWQFMVRDRKIHLYYPLRSCDLVRHFRDDVYMAVRLLLWVLDRCRERGDRAFWGGVVPGDYLMHMTSLHVFENDRRAL